MSGLDVTALRLSSYSVPTETDGAPRPESDGTATWSETGVLVAEVEAGGRTGLGFAYAAAPAALAVARDVLSPLVLAGSALAPAAAWSRMTAAVRNAGRAGVSAAAVSALDIALHDLQARLLDVSLVRLLGAARPRVAAYGSGGFTDYDEATLRRQLEGWAERGFRSVKIKIGRDPDADPARMDAARAAIGDDVALFVDANGAFRPKQALRAAEAFADRDVRWFEEPVSSDDLPGLGFVREHVTAGVDVAAGEYGYTRSTSTRCSRRRRSTRCRRTPRAAA